MKVYIVTSNVKKEKELSRYFKNIGLKTTHIATINGLDESSLFDDKNDTVLLLSEQTKLHAKNSKANIDLNVFQEAEHKSTVSVRILKRDQDGVIAKEKKNYRASVNGLIFPDLKTDREDVYNWDEIFVSEKSMISYQEMKDKGLKNSARDLAFSLFIDDMSSLFKFEDKVNLNFNKAEVDEVVSFEPFIESLLQNNPYYAQCKTNDFFSNLLSNVIAQGIFIRRAEDRSQRNYWLPGLNAGIPLTPKKDDIHEATFMFHDIMHFIYPDLIITENTKEAKHIYIISRMMSEAFTIILADMLFVSLLDKADIDYDFDKRKIYPLFKKIGFDVSVANMDRIKSLLWANTCFALLGEESLLRELVKDDALFDAYKEKYQRFFQEDYKWTERNYDNISKSVIATQQWYDDISAMNLSLVQSTQDYASDFTTTVSLKEQVAYIFDKMFIKLKTFAEVSSGNIDNDNAFRRYMLGQITIFYKYNTVYNKLFLSSILKMLGQEVINKEKVGEIYELYLEKLVGLNLITVYEKNKYCNIFPVFEPFYVFYESKKEEGFIDVLKNIFGESYV